MSATDRRPHVLVVKAREISIASRFSRGSAYGLLLLIFILGLSSALISLVATTWLQTNKLSTEQAEVVVGQLVNLPSLRQITEINGVVDNYNDNPPPFTAIKVRISNLFSLADKDRKDRLLRLATQVGLAEKRFTEFGEALERFQEEHNKLVNVNETLIKVVAPTTLLNSAYDAQQRLIYQIELNSYYEKLTRQVDWIVQDVNPVVRAFNVRFRTNAAILDSQLTKDSLQSLAQRALFIENNNQDVISILERGTTNLKRLAHNNDPKPPEVSERLTEMGDVGKLIQWLVSPSSIELLNIIGMIAFGILGSSLTTFVSANALVLQDPGLKDVISVIVKGVTAAVVVYLFILGGFEIFSESESVSYSPNVYMLFLTCFLGAVYSDRIWRYAEARLIKRLKEQQGHTKADKIHPST